MLILIQSSTSGDFLELIAIVIGSIIGIFLPLAIIVGIGVLIFLGIKHLIKYYFEQKHKYDMPEERVEAWSNDENDHFYF